MTKIGSNLGWWGAASGGGGGAAGRLFVWGSSGGIGATASGNPGDNFSSPVQVGTGTDWGSATSIRGVVGHAIRGGKLYSWGDNTTGQLGLNDVASRSSPTQVGARTDWASVSGSGGFGWSAAITTAGKLYTWGQNDNGQLGLGAVGVARSSPTQVGTGTNWVDVRAASAGTAIARKTDGTVWTWGSGGAGALGDGSTVNKSSPVQVGTGSNWSIISSTFNNQASMFAIDTSGRLFAWGYGGYGILGDGTAAVAKSSPTQVGSGTGWSAIGGWSYGAHGVRNGALFGWGINTQGTIGDGSTISKSSPVQIGTGTNWSKVSLGGQRVGAAITADGKLYSWGVNSAGQLGIGTVGTPQSSPTQVGSGTNWQMVSLSNSPAVGIRT